MLAKDKIPVEERNSDISDQISMDEDVSYNTDDKNSVLSKTEEEVE